MPKKCFVIGHPVAHSKSPRIHNHWLNALGIKGSYEAVDVTPEALPQFFDNLRKGAFTGGNVTIPHKENALQLCDDLTTEAQEIGAVNTLIVKDSHITGANTDMSGFLANLDTQAPGWDSIRKAVIVIGAGGAARAILIGLKNRGFEHIIILNRTKSRAVALAKELIGPFEGRGLESFRELAPEADLLVNTSSVGMHGTAHKNLDLSALKRTATVTDIVYTPLITPLLAEAKAQGLKTVDGLGMLLHQAVPGFEAWFGQRPEVTPDLRQMIIAELEAKQ